MRFIFILVFCLSFLSFQIMGLNANEYQIQILTSEFPPYNYQENGKVEGFATDVVRLIMKKLGVNHQINFYPDARVHRMLENEKGILCFVLFRTEEREDKYKWIGPIATDHVYIYKRKESPIVINNIRDALEAPRVVSWHDGVIYSRLIEMGFNNIDMTSSLESIHLKIINKRSDLMVSMPSLSVVYWFKQNGYPIDIIEQTPVKIDTFEMYIACTKDVPDSLINEWQNVLDSIKVSGEFDELFNSYK
ncbi:MAG: transporter substrate-binding domain-containing protein [Deltaproteobacteria bacterium]|nr:transporter substrate-binding domain-containing protein [Deltaproteobacteria bacterium]